MALALLCGVLIRRVLPAMIAFIVTFGACAYLSQTWLRPWLFGIGTAVKQVSWSVLPGAISRIGCHVDAQIPQSHQLAPVLRSGGPEILREDAWSRMRLQQSLADTAAATATTILAALWPDSHHIRDWRVLAAVTGLGIIAGGDENLGLAEADSRTQLQPTLDQYARIRALLIRLGNQAGVPVTTLKRALYLMSRAVQGKGKSWAEYGAALAAAVPVPGSAADDDGTSDDE